jgi:galactose mutarotase-like enzyme
MVQIEIVDGIETYTIVSTNGSTRASFVPDFGGAATSIIMPGLEGPRELLFNSPEVLGWPFCFPVCGRLEYQEQLNRYVYNQHIYELPIHGFAAHLPWRVKSADQHHLRLTLRDNEQTRAVYPFHFNVELWYEISHRNLFCRQIYTNHGDRPMPYYAGFHPYFLTPPPRSGKEKVILNFRPERRMLYNERLTHIIGEQDLFNLPISVADPQIHEQLLQLGEERECHLQFPNGDLLNLAAEGVEDKNLFPYIQIYSPADQPFICIEPWMGYPNALNKGEGVRWLAPGQSEHGVLRLWLE